jgi:DNA-binding NarL/FixJ family response regulator
VNEKTDHGGAVRLVVADDSLLVRQGIVRLLSSRGFDVVAEAGDGEELLRKTAGYKPDAVVVDIRMPPTGTDEGLRAAEQLAKQQPTIGVLVLSDYLEAEYATRLLESGAPGRGYLLKETVTDGDAFADALRRVSRGESVVDPAIVRRVLGRLRAENPFADLTQREREILTLMAEGRSNQAIASHFVLSERTVEGHVARIFHKLGLATRPDDHRRVLAVLAYLRGGSRTEGR